MSTLAFLTAADVERALPPGLCIEAVEAAFAQLARSGAAATGILGLHAGEGSFHVKAGVLQTDRPYFAAKVNANFPGNFRLGLPTIQGVVYLCDASNGEPLAVMDSGSITALRTAAATAVAAKHLAAAGCEVALICGCGAQALPQLRALQQVRQPRRWLAFDAHPAKANAFAEAARVELGIAVSPVTELARAVDACRIIVTCTTARRFFIGQDMVRPGTFIAAVGADNEDKQEIDPRLLAAAKVVTDLTAQAMTIGDLHHAIASGLMTRDDVHAELGEVAAGLKPGRTDAAEVTIFDSTGTGIQDVAAAVAAYRSYTTHARRPA